MEAAATPSTEARDIPRQKPQPKFCKNCKSEMPLGAKLCSVCKSYQNWIGGLNNSSLILSLLIALFSVLSTAVPAIKTAIRPARSELRLLRFYYTENGVSLILGNHGSMPAFVSSCKMLLLNEASPVFDFNFNLDRPTDTRIVRSDSVVEMFFKTDQKWMTQVLQERVPNWQRALDSGHLKAKLLVDLTQYDGTTQHQEGLTALKDFYFKY